MLHDEAIQFQVCKNLVVKCAVMQSTHSTISNRLYKYFTYKNTFRHINIFPKFVKA